MSFYQSQTVPTGVECQNRGLQVAGWRRLWQGCTAHLGDSAGVGNACLQAPTGAGFELAGGGLCPPQPGARCPAVMFAKFKLPLTS